MAAFLVQRLHPALSIGAELIANGDERSGQRVLLFQGSCDNSCGLMTLMMALIVLGEIDYRAAVYMLGAKKGPLRTLASRAASAFLEGLDEDELVEALEASALRVKVNRLTGNHRACLNHSLRALSGGSVALVGIVSRSGAFSHWTLAVGVEGFQRARRFTPETLLFLDPLGEPWPRCGFNARLSLTEPRPGARYLRYTSSATPRLEVTTGVSIALSSEWRKW